MTSERGSSRRPKTCGTHRRPFHEEIYPQSKQPSNTERRLDPTISIAYNSLCGGVLQYRATYEIQWVSTKSLDTYEHKDRNITGRVDTSRQQGTRPYDTLRKELVWSANIQPIAETPTPRCLAILLFLRNSLTPRIRKFCNFGRA